MLHQFLHLAWTVVYTIEFYDHRSNTTKTWRQWKNATRDEYACLVLVEGAPLRDESDQASRCKERLTTSGSQLPFA